MRHFQKIQRVVAASRGCSGLVFCGKCGGAYTIKSGDQLACSAHREKSTGDNGRTIRIDELERRVFDGLQRRLLAPESIAQFVIEYSAERARLHELDKRARGELAKRITLAKQRIERLVDAIAAGAATRATCERLIAEEAECARMEQERSNMEARARSVIELHPRAIARYQERVAALTDTLRDGTSSATRSSQFFVALSIASTLRRYRRVAK